MKLYRGTPRRTSTGGFIVEIVDGETGATSALKHYTRHSPDGFAWGYEGSGPAELARCLLIDALDLHDKTMPPMGSGGIQYEIDVLVPPSMYQAFKRNHIAIVPMNDAWTLQASFVKWWAENWREKHGERSA